VLPDKISWGQALSWLPTYVTLIKSIAVYQYAIKWQEPDATGLNPNTGKGGRAARLLTLVIARLINLGLRMGIGKVSSSLSSFSFSYWMYSRPYYMVGFQAGVAYYILPRSSDTIGPVQFWNYDSRRL